ncbi:uncharacterized protein [Antedon mediterranea]|uniref:uncharacterized protein n=1 Tax=Antedon mediterranea TaxID=105859 RepID=UPI003AF65A67
MKNPHPNPALNLTPEGSIPDKSSRPTTVIEAASQIGNALLKKELVNNSLRKFTEKAAHYRAWKAAFHNTTMELNLTPSQKLELLMKWLGSESHKLSISIYNSHISRPELRLERIWEILDNKYGLAEALEKDIQTRIETFPKMNTWEAEKIMLFSQLMNEIQYMKEEGIYPGLAALDSARGLHPLVEKLPNNLQEKWCMTGSQYKLDHKVLFPPFNVYFKFVQKYSKIWNDPSFCRPANHKNSGEGVSKAQRPLVNVKNTNITNKDVNDGMCPLHEGKHPLVKCRVFIAKSYLEKKKLIKDYKLCFRCLGRLRILKRTPQQEVKNIEKNDSVQPKQVKNVEKNTSTPPKQVGKNASATNELEYLSPSCLDICGREGVSRSCSKIFLANVYLKENPDKVVKTYVLIDEQSNKSLVAIKMFDLLEISGELINYRIKTCNGEKKTTGRKLQSVDFEAINREVQIILPNLLECEEIPGNKSEIPTPEVAMAFPHLESIAAKIPSIDKSAEVRETCLGEVHVPNTSISACRTSVKIQSNGKPSTLDPCPNKVKVDELFDSGEDTISFSREEKQFLKIMETEGKLNPDKQWTAPLPFRTPRPRLPNNREQALKRALILHKSLEKDSIKRQHFIAFMKGVLDNGHAEKAPPLKAHEERWYLPLFGVYHPKKFEKIRGVFDSSAVFQGVSLNQVLFKGPDLTNGLVGVLMRFRREGVAVCGDIESMFYCFGVVEKHRNFLRFFWYEENDLSKPLIEYRMCKHVFGNKPSPAVANYGLREIVKEADPDVVDFVNNNFYVDDGLTSCEDDATTISLMKRTQQALMTSGGVRLHKISSNIQEVLNAFEREDIAKEIRDFNVEEGGAPIQRSLGLQWRLFEDVFTFHINPEEKPFTKRGVLATINSIYDPLGFIFPVLVRGRVLFRTIMHLKLDWDDPLPEGMKHKWDAWKESLKKLASLKIQRTYHKSLRNNVINTKVHVYCDASEQAVAAVAFLRTTTIHGTEVGFLIGISRIAPKQGHTIPRLELCSTVVLQN